MYRRILVVLLILAVLGSGGPGAYGYDLSGVSIAERSFRYGVSFAQDSNHNVAVAYFNPDRKLYFRRFGPQGWAEELADSGTISLGSRNYTSLLFVNDQPHIVFLDSIQNRLKHAWRDPAGQWSSEVIDGNGNVGSHLAAVNCNFGEICVSYYDVDNTSLKFAKGHAGSWNVVTVDDPANDVGQFSSIALTILGRPIIAYYDSSDLLPKVATQNEDSSWNIESLPEQNMGYGRWTSIVQGADGTTHLSAGSYYDAYLGNSDGYLFYASKPQGGSWTVTQLSALNTSAWTSISLLPDNHPQIAARHMNRSAVVGESVSVYHAYINSQGLWEGSYITPNDEANNFISVRSMVDHWGNPQVAYYFTAGTSQSSGLALHAPVDSDGDQLPNTVDGGINNVDIDGDTLRDGYEKLTLGTNSYASDSDADGINDLLDADPTDPLTTNLVVDGNAERPLVNAWSPLNSPKLYQKDVIVAAAGQSSLYVVGGDNSFRGVEQRNLTSSTGTRYRLQLYYQRASGSTRISIGWGNDVDFEAASFVDDSSEDWQSYSRYFFTPEGAGDLRLMIDTNGSTFVDAIQLYPAPFGSEPIPQPTLRPAATPTPSATPTPIETQTPASTAAPTPGPTETVTPTPSFISPEPTATPPAPTPTRSLRLSLRRMSLRSYKLTGYARRGMQPLARLRVSCACDGRLVSRAISSQRGIVTFYINTRSVSQICRLTSGKLRSRSLRVPSGSPRSILLGIFGDTH